MTELMIFEGNKVEAFGLDGKTHLNPKHVAAQNTLAPLAAMMEPYHETINQEGIGT